MKMMALAARHNREGPAVASGTFNSVGGAFSRDPIAEAHRAHEARRRRNAYDVRVTGFVARHLCGRSFHSLEQLTAAACGAALVQLQHGLAPEQHAAITRVCRSLWAGVAETRHLGGVRYRIAEQGVRRLTFYDPMEHAA